ncbi:MAG: 2-C-methyl-D-erythritol 4-phosphate cytidylyltransferase [Chlamydiae bacterium]|nr:2-C-methyl-D-erythritol 4-phosphate cytidylyltransferase [Chlamydiota bacterium]
MYSFSKKISVILLAGGLGTRMKAQKPKQFLKLFGKEIALYSFEIFSNHPQVHEIVVVCEAEYQPMFTSPHKPVYFANPGKRRQDSTYNGLQKVSKEEHLVCVHDAARPCLDLEILNNLFEVAYEYKAATLGIRATSTLKEVNADGFLVKSIERKKVWMIQTPQVILKSLMEKGFQKAKENGLEVTDETSLINLIGHRVKMVESTSENIKLTEPADLEIIESFLSKKDK